MTALERVARRAREVEDSARAARAVVETAREALAAAYLGLYAAERAAMEGDLTDKPTHALFVAVLKARRVLMDRRADMAEASRDLTAHLRALALFSGAAAELAGYPSPAATPDYLL